MNSIPRSLGLVLLLVRVVVQVSEGECLSPDAIVASDKQLFIACETGRQVLCLDLAAHQTTKVSMPLPVSGLALSRDYSTLFVTCAGPESKVCLVDTRRMKIVGTIRVGHTARAPVLSPDGGTLYVCDQFEDEVSVIDLMGLAGGSGGRKEDGGWGRPRNTGRSGEGTPDVVPYKQDPESPPPDVHHPSILCNIASEDRQCYGGRVVAYKRDPGPPTRYLVAYKGIP
jgi:hypothetical protein